MIIFSKDNVREPLFAVVPYYNPWRWKSRVKHTQRALKHFHDAGCVIVLVEVGMNRRDLVFADSGLDGTLPNCPILGTESKYRHKYIGLHTKDELWLKESAINIGVQSLPYDWNQVCWLDADVLFVRPNWVGEAIHKLQHGGAQDAAFLQMFSHARDVGPNYEMLDEDYPHANGLGFIHAWKEGFIHSSPNTIIEADVRTIRKDTRQFEMDFHREQDERAKKDIVKLDKSVKKLATDFQYGDKRVWPGLAWACTRPAWEATGGLFDMAIWGGGDWHMSHALIEKTEGMMRNDLHRNYKKMVMQWYQRCRTHIRQNVLVMDGSILHFWHGKKIGRGYNAKHALLAKVGFDPLRHLKRDSQGLLALHDDRSPAYPQLRDLMRRIAKERNEDSIDL
jgi:hypothetical protein